MTLLTPQLSPPLPMHWINDAQALEALCQQLQQQSVIALDTEFARSRTYYPHIGLLQIADPQGIYLIDPLAIDERKAFVEVLLNPDIVKVVHSASEDLEVFEHAFGVLPTSLFDTQIAAAFAGFGPSIGYANLLRELKGIDIPKQETRSDWLQRPLSDAQITYAALDVAYLLEVYQLLNKELEHLQRLEWVCADSTALVEKQRGNNHPETYYQRIKLAWKLKPKQLAVLKQLCHWRELQALSQDVPRGRIIKDNSLYEIAMRLPRNHKQLQAIRDIPSGVLESSASEWLSMIEAVVHDETDSCQYPPRLPGPLNVPQTELLKQLKRIVATIAESLNLPQELLVRKKDYTALLHSLNPSSKEEGACQLPNTLKGWRKDVVGQALLSYLQQHAVQSGES